MGVALLLSSIQLNAMAQTEGELRAGTSVSLDLPERCPNTMTCNAIVFTGKPITFSGMLTDRAGMPLANMTVNISALIPTPEVVMLTSTTTNNDGMFEVEWIAKLSAQEKPEQTIVDKRAEVVSVFAQFPGDDTYAPSRSNKLSLEVKINMVNTKATSDRLVYKEGESATIVIAFIDSDEEFTDPGKIYATLNNAPIKLEKKKEGSYIFTIPQLPKQLLQLIIAPNKAGYTGSNAYLTIIVLR